MANKTAKTTATAASVTGYISALESPRRQEEARNLLTLFQDVTGEAPKMWGPSIIGYGSYHYKYESGREGESCRTGFSPRKDKISVYLTGGYCNPATETRLAQLRARLGKHSTGASCLYISKLADVDLSVLSEMVKVNWDYMAKTYPE